MSGGPELGTLKRLDPRSVWENEAHHFTPWLAEHLDSLGELLGLDLELLETESAVGDFAIDILAKDLGSERRVVVENQLAATDHSHLGQLLTYAAGVDAGVVVWVTPDFRPEHRQALDWLNRGLLSKTQFFGVVLELLQVDDSRPAPNLRIVAAPNEWSAGSPAPGGAADLTEKQLAYRSFFQRVIDELRERHRFTNARAGQPQNWYTFSTGTTGFSYSLSFATKLRVRTELYIDFPDAEMNLAILRKLKSEQEQLTKEFGDLLTFEDLDNRRACRIACYRAGSIDDPQDRVDEYQAWAVDRLLRFKRVFGQRLPGLAAKPASPAMIDSGGT